jgi:hypothetical protein
LLRLKAVRCGRAGPAANIRTRVELALARIGQQPVSDAVLGVACLDGSNARGVELRAGE